MRIALPRGFDINLAGNEAREIFILAVYTCPLASTANDFQDVDILGLLEIWTFLANG